MQKPKFHLAAYQILLFPLLVEYLKCYKWSFRNNPSKMAYKRFQDSIQDELEFSRAAYTLVISISILLSSLMVLCQAGTQLQHN